MPSQKSEPKKRGIQPRFTTEEVLAAAVDLLDSEPAETFTMRRLAERLDIGVMTLYGYVASKEELLEGVAAAMFDDVGAQPASNARWEDQLREQALGIHAIVLRHPNLARALRAHSSPNPSLFGVRERMLRVLVDAGFQPARALHILGVLTSYAQGFASVQAASLDPHVLTERVRELPSEDFPLLVEFADAYADHVSDASFALGLDLLIDGLQRELAGPHRRSSSDS